MSELRDFGVISLTRAARYLVGKPMLHCAFEVKNTLTKTQSSWTAISLATQSAEKAQRDWLVAQIGTVKSGSTLHSLLYAWI